MSGDPQDEVVIVTGGRFLRRIFVTSRMEIC